MIFCFSLSEFWATQNRKQVIIIIKSGKGPEVHFFTKHDIRLEQRLIGWLFGGAVLLNCTAWKDTNAYISCELLLLRGPPRSWDTWMHSLLCFPAVRWEMPSVFLGCFCACLFIYSGLFVWWLRGLWAKHGSEWQRKVVVSKSVQNHPYFRPSLHLGPLFRGAFTLWWWQEHHNFLTNSGWRL